MNSTTLVVGIDSALGGGLLSEISRRGQKVFGTTRRLARRSRDAVRLLDLSEPVPAWISRAPLSFAYLCAAVSTFGENENDPSYARLVNVTRTVELADALMSRGTFVVFPSTTAVFPSDFGEPTERATTNPTTSYGVLKVEAEQELLRVARRHASPAGLAIVRITKVVTAAKEPFSTWLTDLRHGRAIHPYSDLSFAPVSLKYAVNGLLEIGRLQQSGVYHLSGLCSVTYAAFAILIARALGANDSLVVPARIPTRNGSPVFPPVRAVLGMEETGRHLGLAPQKPEEAAAHLVEQRTRG